MTSSSERGADFRASKYDVAPPRREERTGWLVCGAMLSLVSGGLIAILGLVALNRSELLANELLFSELSTWGWILLGWGLLQAIAGAFAWAGSSWANTTGNVMAMTGIVLWFAMVFAAPFAAIVGIAINMMIVYGLTVGADSARA